MKPFFTSVFCLFLTAVLHAQTPENYPISPDAQEQTGVPKGELLKFTFENSKIFPGTWREYWVYVPAQYSPEKAACVYVGQDGVQFNAPTVFDNLIHKKEMPVTIGVFVMHGRVRAAKPDEALDRFNRSFEYDGLGNNYARFLLEELFPEIETKKTSDGRALKLSKNGNDRAIGGVSSGAICAFTAAWERPDAFSRVFSGIGTYVGLRGGDHYPSLVRKHEPKPIRVFLQDGSNDLNIYAGDWWMANQTMERALTWAGYEVQHVWGEGAHNGKHSGALFPDAMRYLWKDWPTTIKMGVSKNQMLNDVLMENEGWQLVGDGYKFTEGCTANAKGEVFFDDGANNKIWKVAVDGSLSLFAENSNGVYGQAFGSDGKMLAAAQQTKSIVAYESDGKFNKIADGFSGNDLTVAQNGNIYVTNPLSSTNEPSKIWFIKPNGEKQEFITPMRFANGLALSPDQTQLYVTDSRSHWVYAYQIQADGALAQGQKYGWLHEADNAEEPWPDGIKTDRDGRIYVTTRMGVQILDQTGRVNVIVPVPSGQPSNICFGGPNFDVMYVTSSDKVYRRKTKVRGANNWDKPNKPAPPKL